MLSISAATKGQISERLTAALLWLKGYRILGLNRRIAGVEVDVLARHRRTLVVVEVKVRTSFEEAVAAIRPPQQHRLHRVLQTLAAHDQLETVRLDTVVWAPAWPFYRHDAGIL
jgi:Holliday junction resolvase-like predicted endonuclease